MPRRKKEDGQEGAVAPALAWPEGIPDHVWEHGRALGNVALAADLHDVLDGKRAPRDLGETFALMDAARKLEARAYKHHAKLVTSVGAKIRSAQDAHADARRNVDTLTRIMRDPEHLTRQLRNGHSDQETRGGADE